MPRAWQRCYIVYATLLSRPLEDHPSRRRFPTKPEFDLNNARNIEETTRHLSHVTYQFSMTPTFVKLGGKLAAAIGGRDRLLEPPSLPSLLGDTDELCEKKTTSRLDDGDFDSGKRKRARKKGSLL
ncbi:hypothetical protein HZH68_014885 [Vespula germanica]|uniref:Uncharacterized protein n=1 Tax=Vespula germanica TaxID=30212 RepID=A0A834J8J3_VESGE|nr:hypothetical protein HZH68_014885 [Vespula germanica]